MSQHLPFKAVKEQQVLNVINDLKENKACGPDSKPVSLWKIIAEYIQKPFTYTVRPNKKETRKSSYFSTKI